VFVVLLIAGLALRVAALPLPGTEDVGVWKLWSYHASRDITTMYGVGGDPPVRGTLRFGRFVTTVDYPPVALYAMGLVGLVYRATLPTYPDDWRLTAAVKLPGLVAGALLTALLYLTAYRATGRQRVAELAALACWLNPATLLNGEILGYLDPLLMLPAVGALVLVHRQQFVWAGTVLSMAVLTKPQGILIVPACLLAITRLGGCSALRRAGAGAVAMGAAIFLPFVLAGTLPNAVNAFSSFARRDILSAYAANIWWIVNWLERARLMLPDVGFPDAYLRPVARILALSSFLNLGWPNPRPYMALAIAIIVGWALWRTRRSRDLGLHAAVAALTVHAYFTLAVGVHENHIMLAVPLLALAAAFHREFRGPFVLISVVAALGMNMFYGFGRGMGWAIPRTLTILDLSVVNASVNVGTFVWLIRCVGRVARAVEGTTTAGQIAGVRQGKLDEVTT
jgi:hypothetical protein